MGDSVSVAAGHAAALMVSAQTDTPPVQPFASVTPNVNAYVPGIVGMPLNMPSLAAISPGGNAPDVTLNVYGAVPPAISTAAGYGTPAMPFGGFAVPESRGQSPSAPIVIVTSCVTTHPSGILASTVNR